MAWIGGYANIRIYETKNSWRDEKQVGLIMLMYYLLHSYLIFLDLVILKHMNSVQEFCTYNLDA